MLFTSVFVPVMTEMKMPNTGVFVPVMTETEQRKLRRRSRTELEGVSRPHKATNASMPRTGSAVSTATAACSGLLLPVGA